MGYETEAKGLDIAVIGMAIRFPDASTPDAYWHNLMTARESLTWSKAFDQPEGREDSFAVPAGFLLDNVECFDAPFFGMSPREAALTDPQHRVLMECAFNALEHAGYAEADLCADVGVFVGCGPNYYLSNNLWQSKKVQLTSTPLQILLSNEKDYLATRISYKLNLRGPSIVVQSACSTSLLAIHLAARALFSGDCDIGLAGGVSIGCPQSAGYTYQPGSILSPDGHCKPFSANAAGTVPGNGAGIVVLKRLADALAARDTVYAVIRGSAANNDGAGKVGFAAPSVEGQSRVIRMAQAVAEVDSGEIGFVEAHGTATTLGDPIEVAALAEAFGTAGRAEPCLLGSVKSNIGHLDAAAGVAGFVKAVLALYHGWVPPTLHFDAPNPAIDFDAAGFRVNEAAVPWSRGAQPRLAGVSSLGIGGTNVHVILEEAPAAAERPSLPINRPVILRLSAQSAASLKGSASAVAKALRTMTDDQLRDTAFTLKHGRRAFNKRLAVVSATASGAAEMLERATAGETLSGECGPNAPAVSLMFPGQGAQHVGMGAGLFRDGGTFARIIREGDEILRPKIGQNLSSLLYPDAGKAEWARRELRQTRFTQPALFLVEYALARHWMEWGLRPHGLIGHSIGEYVAACVSSVIGFEEALELVHYRGQLMQGLPTGAMLAVMVGEENLVSRLPPTVSLAAVNRPGVCVVSGPHAEVDLFAERLGADGIVTHPLETSHAFHSAMMDPCCPVFAKAFDGIRLCPPEIPFISCVTGTWITESQATDPAYWTQQLRRTVRFADGLRTVISREPHILLECGPGRALSAAARDLLRTPREVAIIPVLPAEGQDLDDIIHGERVRAQMWCCGVDLEPNGEFEECGRVPLPTYAFERTRHWIEPEDAPQTEVAGTETAEEEPVSVAARNHADASLGQSGADQLGRLWAEALGVDSVGPDDDFFGLGGDSLLSIQIAHQARAIGLNLQPRTILEHATVNRVLAALGRTSADVDKTNSAPWPDDDSAPDYAAALVPRPEDAFEPFPLTDIQHAYWIGRNTKIGHERTAAHSYEEFECEKLDAARLTKALRGMIRRHPMMRAVITPDGRQRVLPEVPDYVIPVTDLRGMGAEAAEQELAQIRNAKSHQILDCETWPLFDVAVTRLPDGTSRLHVSFDLLIMDAWSIAIFWEELERRYVDIEYDPPEPAVSFRDYVLASSRLEEGQAFEQAKDYWLSRLDDFPGSPALPLLRSPDELMGTRFVRREKRISADRWKRLKQRAAEQGTTPSVVLCTAFAEILAMWSETPRFSLNLPALSRLPIHAEIGEVMGDFTSTILFEVDMSADVTFAERAAALQRRLWDDLAGLQFSGVRMLRAIAEQKKNRLVMPYVFTSLIFPGATRRSVVGRLGRLVEGISQTPQVWLDCQVCEDGPDLVLNWDSIEDLFNPGMLDTMFSAYLDLLDGLALEGTVWTHNAWRDERALANVSEDRKVANRTTTSLATSTLHSGFLEQAEVRGSELAVVCAESSSRLTYHDLDRASAWIANALADGGALANQTVAVVARKGWEQVAATLAASRAGMAYVPLDPDLPRERLHLLFRIARAGWAVTTPDLEERVDWPDGIRRIQITSAVLGGTAAWKDRPVSVDAPAYVIFTSGTTGEPKGVTVTHRAASNTIADINRRFEVTQRDVVLGLSALSFDLSVYDIFGTLAAGGTLVLPSPADVRDPAAWDSLARREGVTIWNSVPALAELQATHAELSGAPPLKGLRLVMMSGDWIPLSLPPRLRALAPQAMQVSLGGATEAAIWSIYHVIERVEPWWRSVPYGRPLANQTFEVLDTGLRARPDGIAGELFIGGIGLAEEYIGNPNETNRRFLRNPRTGERLYRTGDIGRWLPGGIIEFLGRADSQVKINGYRVEVGEIEAAAARHPDIRACAVILLTGPNGSPRLVGYVCAHPGVVIEPETIRRYLSEQLPAYMVPALVSVLDELPLSANGKVDRARLPAQHPASGHKAPADPCTTTEAAVTALWTTVVGHRNFSMTETFFESGGDSLRVTELVMRIRIELCRDFPLRAAFETPTVRSVALAIDEASARSTSCTAPGPHPRIDVGRSPLTSAQERLWFHDLLTPNSPTYTIVEPFQLTGDLDPQILRRAFAAFVTRHEALRSVIVQDGHRAVQLIRPDQDSAFQILNLQPLPPADAAATREKAIRDAAGTIFDLASGPLIQAQLLRFSPRDHTLIVAVHHIVWDGWSTAIMIREVSQLYSGLLREAMPALARPVSIGDVAEWEAAQLQAGAFENQLSYWVRKLAPPLPVLALPEDAEAAARHGLSGAREAFTLPSEIHVNFVEICRARGVTIFAGYLAAWQTLLSCWCAQDDIVVGIPAGHRSYPQLASTIGFLVNSLAIRTRFKDGSSFAELMREVQGNVMEAFANQDVPFDRVVEATKPVRSNRESAPLFRSWFVLHDVPYPAWNMEGVTSEHLDAQFLLSVHDIKLSLTPMRNGIECGLDYRTSLFRVETVRRLGEQFLRLVRTVLEQPDVPISDLRAVLGLTDPSWPGRGERSNTEILRSKRVPVRELP